MADGWVEPRARVPLVGIIAIVLVVALVAVFLKAQMSALFPQSAVTVTAASDADMITGNAVTSFEGVRESVLEQRSVYKGTLFTDGTTLQFMIDDRTGILTITQDGFSEDVVLKRVGDQRISEFEYRGVQTRIETDLRTLTLTAPGKGAYPIKILLSEVLVYSGVFAYRDADHQIVVYPDVADAIISANGDWQRVPLAVQDATYTGLWTEGGRSHPVIVDLAARRVTLEEMW